MLKVKSMQGQPELPDAFKDKQFRSYADIANFADDHPLPMGEYWIINDKGGNLSTHIRLLRISKGAFWVEGRGNI